MTPATRSLMVQETKYMCTGSGTARHKQESQLVARGNRYVGVLSTALAVFEIF